MALNDPLGDLIARIRNAQMRNKSKVSSPGSTLRARVLDVLKNEGYIRGYSTTEYGNGRTEFEVELKYFDGEPVIREIARVSKPGRRVYASVKTLPMEERFAATLKLAEMPRNSSATRIRLRCELTGRPRSNYRKNKLSRIALRDLGSKGMVPGLVKSSW